MAWTWGTGLTNSVRLYDIYTNEGCVGIHAHFAGTPPPIPLGETDTENGKEIIGWVVDCAPPGSSSSAGAPAGPSHRVIPTQFGSVTVYYST